MRSDASKLIAGSAESVPKAHVKGRVSRLLLREEIYCELPDGEIRQVPTRGRRDGFPKVEASN